MALRAIVKYPDPRLRAPTEEVREFNAELRTLVADMAETMYASNGAGLAAIQVGVFKRLFIVEAAAAGGNENDPPIAFVNPVIEELSKEIDTGEEGCLSFPGVYLPVKRSARARVRAQDIQPNGTLLASATDTGAHESHSYCPPACT